MNWEAFLIPITESDTSANEWHNGTLSEWEEYYGKAKKGWFFERVRCS